MYFPICYSLFLLLIHFKSWILRFSKEWISGFSSSVVPDRKMGKTRSVQCSRKSRKEGFYLDEKVCSVKTRVWGEEKEIEEKEADRTNRTNRTTKGRIASEKVICVQPWSLLLLFNFYTLLTLYLTFMLLPSGYRKIPWLVMAAMQSR